MKFDPRNGSWKLGEYSYSVDKKMIKEAYRKVSFKTKIITIIIIILFISRLIFIFYPLDLMQTLGIKNITVDDISSIHFQQMIKIPKGMDMEAKEISMNEIGKKLDELWPLPLSEHSESYPIFMPNITDKSFIEEVLLELSNHTMRKSRGRGRFPIDNSMPDSTIIFIRLKDDNKTEVHIFIGHDPRNISINRLDSNEGTRYYKLYGDGIDTQKLFELTRKL